MCWNDNYYNENISSIKIKLENEYNNYTKSKKQIDTLLSKYYDKNKNIFKINKFLLGESLINKKLLNYYGFSIVNNDNLYIIIKKNDIKYNIQSILEETKKTRNEYIIKFNLIKKYMPIYQFLIFMNKYNNKWLVLDIKYNNKLVKINLK